VCGTESFEIHQGINEESGDIFPGFSFLPFPPSVTVLPDLSHIDKFNSPKSTSLALHDY
jgi:hypothetical protein